MKLMHYPHFSKNGQLLPSEQASVPLDNIAYSYGFGVYETMRVSGGIVYFMPDHLERLSGSAQEIGLEHGFSAEFISNAIQELIDANQAEACNLKLLLIGGRTADDAQLFIQCLNPLFPDRKLYKQGATAITEHYTRRYPHAKTLNMLPSYLAYRKAQAAGAYDALLVDDANITEGTRTNFFALDGRTLISPPEDKILLGVMRKVVLKVAKANGFSIEERAIPLQSLSDHDAACVTSTSSKIMPLRSIDDHQFGEPSESLKELMQLTDKFLAGCNGILG
jgi:branched-chain amino acid aminotransferase